MIPAYPSGLPLPQRSNYALERVNQIRRTEMDVGRAVQRLEFEDIPVFPQLTWRFTEVQARLFVAWATQVAKTGWWTATLLTPMGFEEVKVRFTESPKGQQLLGRFHWEYNALCEIEFEPMMPPDWAEVLPDYILQAGIFDIAINREWPLHVFDYATYAQAIADIRNRRSGVTVTVQNDETQGGQHSMYTVGRADSPSLNLDFMAGKYLVGNSQDSLTLVVAYAG